MECAIASPEINGRSSTGVEQQGTRIANCEDDRSMSANGSPDLVQETSSPSVQHLQLNYDFLKVQRLAVADEFSADPHLRNILRGCKWAPDGTCILTNSSDNALRLFNLPSELHQMDGSDQNLPPLKSVLKTQEGGLIYDFCWYPLMSSWEPSTCCFLSTSSKSPVHLWDAYTSKLRATYRIYDKVDKLHPAPTIRQILMLRNGKASL